MKKTLLFAAIAACAAGANGQTNLKELISSQDGYTLEPLWSYNVIDKGAELNHRSGVGVNDKFYIPTLFGDLKVYDKEGKLIKTIPPTEGYKMWTSCNADGAGHVVVQIDKTTAANFGATAGQWTAQGGHGMMIIDSETDEVIEDFLPINIGQAAQRADAMSVLQGNFYETQKIAVWTVVSGKANTWRYLYNNPATPPQEYPAKWMTSETQPRNGEVKESNAGLAENFGGKASAQTTTGYAMRYNHVGSTSEFEIMIYSNPTYDVTYSAEGMYGNGIRKFGQNQQPTDQWYYTPQHSGITGFNMFCIDEKDYIIYPAGKTNASANAFAIAEVSYVNSPATDMTMLGETLVDGKPAGPLKARVFADPNGPAANTGCVPSFNIEPVEGDPQSVYIYFFNSGAPQTKYKFTVEKEDISIGIEGIEAGDSEAPAEYYNLQGVRVANPTHGLYIKAQGGKATKIRL